MSLKQNRFNMRQFAPATILVISIVLIFQNCADPMSLTEQYSRTAELMPFAYDNTVDTIAYMSCAGGPSSSNPNAVWSFRAGSHGIESGLRLTDAFFSATGTLTSGQRAHALNDSPANRDAYLQLSIRQSENYGSVLSSTGGTPVAGRDFSTAIGPIDEFDVAFALASQDRIQPQRVSYFPGTGKYIDAGIRFIESESTAASVRSELTNSGLLTLTYSNGPGDFSARSPDGTVVKVYGRGYKLAFAAPGAGEPEPRVLSSIDEINLETNQPSGLEIKSWSCPATYRYRIARSCADCGCGNDPVGNIELAILRRVLRTEFWYVNVAGRCVVQKETTQQCYPAGTSGNYHFVSVCLRQP